jgi:hypothetical protein
VKRTKVCTRCNVEKEINKENFPTREGGKFRADCRECYNAYKRNSVKDSRHHMVSDARIRARKKGLEFDLIKEEINFPDVCPILKFKLKHGKEEWFNSPSIDRIDNSKGYTMDNIIIVSILANSIKTSATPQQILDVGNFYKKLYKEKGIKYA